MAWLALSIAVLANVIANVSLKLAAKAAFALSPERPLIAFIQQRWTWVGLCAAFVLLVCYLLAIREIGLGVAYATVTSSALVLITVAASLLLHERLSAWDALGIGLVIAGVFVLVRAELNLL